MKSRRKDNEQFKRDAVNLLANSDKPVSQVASDLGINYNILSRWKKEMTDPNKKTFIGNGNSRDEEMAKLRKHNSELKLERDILKKQWPFSQYPRNEI